MLKDEKYLNFNKILFLIYVENGLYRMMYQKFVITSNLVNNVNSDTALVMSNKNFR